MSKPELSNECDENCTGRSKSSECEETCTGRTKINTCTRKETSKQCDEAYTGKRKYPYNKTRFDTTTDGGSLSNHVSSFNVASSQSKSSSLKSNSNAKSKKWTVCFRGFFSKRCKEPKNARENKPSSSLTDTENVSENDSYSCGCRSNSSEDSTSVCSCAAYSLTPKHSSASINKSSLAKTSPKYNCPPPVISLTELSMPSSILKCQSKTCLTLERNNNLSSNKSSQQITTSKRPPKRPSQSNTKTKSSTEKYSLSVSSSSRSQQKLAALTDKSPSLTSLPKANKKSNSPGDCPKFGNCVECSEVKKPTKLEKLTVKMEKCKCNKPSKTSLSKKETYRTTVTESKRKDADDDSNCSCCSCTDTTTNKGINSSCTCNFRNSVCRPECPKATSTSLFSDYKKFSKNISPTEVICNKDSFQDNSENICPDNCPPVSSKPGSVCPKGIKTVDNQNIKPNINNFEKKPPKIMCSSELEQIEYSKLSKHNNTRSSGSRKACKSSSTKRRKTSTYCTNSKALIISSNANKLLYSVSVENKQSDYLLPHHICMAGVCENNEANLLSQSETSQTSSLSNYSEDRNPKCSTLISLTSPEAESDPRKCLAASSKSNYISQYPKSRPKSTTLNNVSDDSIIIPFSFPNCPSKCSKQDKFSISSSSSIIKTDAPHTPHHVAVMQSKDSVLCPNSKCYINESSASTTSSSIKEIDSQYIDKNKLESKIKECPWRRNYHTEKKSGYLTEYSKSVSPKESFLKKRKVSPITSKESFPIECQSCLPKQFSVTSSKSRRPACYTECVRKSSSQNQFREKSSLSTVTSSSSVEMPMLRRPRNSSPKNQQPGKNQNLYTNDSRNNNDAASDEDDGLCNLSNWISQITPKSKTKKNCQSPRSQKPVSKSPDSFGPSAKRKSKNLNDSTEGSRECIDKCPFKTKSKYPEDYPDDSETNRKRPTNTPDSSKKSNNLKSDSKYAMEDYLCPIKQRRLCPLECDDSSEDSLECDATPNLQSWISHTLSKCPKDCSGQGKRKCPQDCPDFSFCPPLPGNESRYKFTKLQSPSQNNRSTCVECKKSIQECTCESVINETSYKKNKSKPQIPNTDSTQSNYLDKCCLCDKPIDECKCKTTDIGNTKPFNTEKSDSELKKINKNTSNSISEACNCNISSESAIESVSSFKTNSEFYKKLVEPKPKEKDINTTSEQKSKKSQSPFAKYKCKDCNQNINECICKENNWLNDQNDIVAGQDFNFYKQEEKCGGCDRPLKDCICESSSFSLKPTNQNSSSLTYLPCTKSTNRPCPFKAKTSNALLENNYKYYEDQQKIPCKICKKELLANASFKPQMKSASKNGAKKSDYNSKSCKPCEDSSRTKKKFSNINKNIPKQATKKYTNKGISSKSSIAGSKDCFKKKKDRSRGCFSQAHHPSLVTEICSQKCSFNEEDFECELLRKCNISSKLSTDKSEKELMKKFQNCPAFRNGSGSGKSKSSSRTPLNRIKKTPNKLKESTMGQYNTRPGKGYSGYNLSSAQGYSQGSSKSSAKSRNCKLCNQPISEHSTGNTISRNKNLRDSNPCSSYFKSIKDYTFNTN